MRTDTLIAVLAVNARPVNPRSFERRLACALGAALGGALVLLLFGYGVRADLLQLAATPIFWAKLALPLTLACAALLATARLARPGVTVGRAWTGLAIPAVLVWIAALVMLWLAPGDARVALVLGRTW